MLFFFFSFINISYLFNYIFYIHLILLNIKWRNKNINHLHHSFYLHAQFQLEHYHGVIQ
jgi:hypothetical protein